MYLTVQYWSNRCLFLYDLDKCFIQEPSLVLCWKGSLIFKVLSSSNFLDILRRIHGKGPTPHRSHTYWRQLLHFAFLLIPVVFLTCVTSYTCCLKWILLPTSHKVYRSSQLNCIHLVDGNLQFLQGRVRNILSRMCGLCVVLEMEFGASCVISRALPLCTAPKARAQHPRPGHLLLGSLLYYLTCTVLVLEPVCKHLITKGGGRGASL